MRLGVLTTGRQDWGILRSTCAALKGVRGVDLCLLAGGMHLSVRYGMTVHGLEEDGFPPDERLAWLDEFGDTAAHVQAARALDRVGAALERQSLDALLLVGDRLETCAAAMAATLGRVAIAHLHGGEETEGAFDNALRNAITKMAHLHLVSHPTHAARVRALGEAPAFIHLVGAPGLDNVRRADLPDRTQLSQELGLPLEPPVVLVTVHPATLASDGLADARAVVAAMDAIDATYLVTLPNSDPGNAPIRALLSDACRKPRRLAVDALGDRRYWGMLKVADAMLGNSSSALIEAPVLELPAVNVGDRQKGRVRGDNVIDCPGEPSAVIVALQKALQPDAKVALRGKPGPFGDGRSGERIAAVLAAWQPPRPPAKPRVAVTE